MGFYVRKGFNFGPLRVNFSKSGVGLSLGVKGFRIGSGPNGNYVHAGRKGVYYKKMLPNVSGAENQLNLSWPVIVVLFVVVGAAYFYFEANGDFDKMLKLILTQLTSG